MTQQVLDGEKNNRKTKKHHTRYTEPKLTTPISLKNELGSQIDQMNRKMMYYINFIIALFCSIKILTAL